MRTTGMFTASVLSIGLLLSTQGMALNSAAATPSLAEDATESDQPVSDTWITTKVKADLLATENVDGSKINVTTVNGVVTLAGKLDNADQVAKAVAVTRAIKGVVSVNTDALISNP